MKVFTTVIRKTERRSNSVNGNPCWRVTTDAGSWLTAADADCAHGITNAEFAAPNEVLLTVEMNVITHVESTGMVEQPVLPFELTQGRGKRLYELERAKRNQSAAARRMAAKSS